ncbi:HMA2 domain-containing protein, partial [Mycobacterium sp. NPDC003449]
MATLEVLSDAAGRMRVRVPWFRGDAVRAVAIEDAVDQVPGVRAVHAYPRTASVVVWYSPKRCDRAAVTTAISAAADVARHLVPVRTPRSADIHNADIVRMAIGAIALALLGI